MTGGAGGHRVASEEAREDEGSADRDQSREEAANQKCEEGAAESGL